MRNTKKTLILSAAILSVLGASSFAMYGQGQRGQGMGNGQGQGLGKVVTEEERTKLQSMSETERQAYAQELREKYNITQGGGHSGDNENPADMIADIPVGTVDTEEAIALFNQYGEEKMARDIYTYAYEKYGLQTFKNIAESEQKHMDAIQVLLDRYNITAPSDYADDNELYEQLKEKVDLSEKDAIEAGILIETTDIENIDKDIVLTDNDDIKIILTKIGGASYNHLRGFVNALNNAGYTTDLEWTDYLSEDELNVKGPLTYKLAERLESEGIDLPEVVSSEYLKENCGSSNHNSTGTVKGKNNRASSQSQPASTNSYAQKKGNGVMKSYSKATQQYINKDKVIKYKGLIEEKYADKLDSYSQEKLEDINTKVDELIEKIAASTNYSEETKDTYINLLLGLKASIEDRLDNIDEEDGSELIDGLF